jgi:hypothetical protein
MRRTKLLRQQWRGRWGMGNSLTFAKFREKASNKQKFYSAKPNYADSILRRNMDNSG